LRSQAYNEEAFQYFLALEGRRTEATGQAFLLVLVDRNARDPRGQRIDPTTAARLFRGLMGCLRETDFVGWYREGHVAGAVLTEFREGLPTGIADVIRRRVLEMLDRQFPRRVAHGLQVHIYEQRELQMLRAANPGRREQLHPLRGIRCSS
jgi:hypothetical protein